MTVGVSLAGGKTLKVVKMSTNQINQATSGDEVHTFTNPDQKNSYNGTITFNAEEWKLYCVYAEGSELGYYGFEFVDGNNTVSNHALPQGQVGAEYDFGQYFDFAAQVYMGKTPAYFATATAPSNSNSQVSGYTAYTTGALGNGGLTGGATTYYIQPYIEGVMRVAVVLNADKRFYIKDLGDNWDAWNNTSGTSVQNYDGITVSSKYYGTYDFHVQANHVYAIYAEGSRLGFYGCELLQETGGSGSSSTITDVVTKKIDTFQDYYGDGRMNVEVHQSELWGFNQYSHGINDPETPHCAIFEFAGRTFVGFEDWVDFDYNDVIYEITGAKGGEELTPDDISYPIYSYAFEDSRNCDYDMNDVVIKATEDGDDIVLKLVAAGATLELYVRIYNYDENSPSSNYYGKSLLTTLTYNYQSEVHAMMGAESGYMINTNADNGYGCNANPIEIRLKKADYGDYRRLRMAIYIPPQKGKDAYEMRLSGSGTAPYGVIIPEDWKWPREWVNVKNAYSEFQGFAETAGANEEWYKKPTLNTVMDEKGFY